MKISFLSEVIASLKLQRFRKEISWFYVSLISFSEWWLWYNQKLQKCKLTWKYELLLVRFCWCAKTTTMGRPINSLLSSWKNLNKNIKSSHTKFSYIDSQSMAKPSIFAIHSNWPMAMLCTFFDKSNNIIQTFRNLLCPIHAYEQVSNDVARTPKMGEPLSPDLGHTEGNFA